MRFSIIVAWLNVSASSAFIRHAPKPWSRMRNSTSSFWGWEYRRSGSSTQRSKLWTRPVFAARTWGATFCRYLSAITTSSRRSACSRRRCSARACSGKCGDAVFTRSPRRKLRGDISSPCVALRNQRGARLVGQIDPAFPIVYMTGAAADDWRRKACLTASAEKAVCSSARILR